MSERSNLDATKKIVDQIHQINADHAALIETKWLGVMLGEYATIISKIVPALGKQVVISSHTKPLGFSVLHFVDNTWLSSDGVFVELNIVRNAKTMVEISSYVPLVGNQLLRVFKDEDALFKIFGEIALEYAKNQKQEKVFINTFTPQLKDLLDSLKAIEPA